MTEHDAPTLRVAREIRYCLNGCTRNTTTGRIPATAEPPAVVCRRCEDNLHRWLEEIPNRYTQLAQYLDPSTLREEPGEESKKGKRRIHSPAPLRLDVLDLMDERRGRKWLGLIPAADRRGALGTLHANAEAVRDYRKLTRLKQRPTVAGEAAFLRRHLLWLTEQDWVVETYEEIRTLHRELGDAIGEHRPRAVGTCVVLVDDTECGGPLLPARLGGVHCPRCGAAWDIDELRRLGLMLTQEPA